MSNGHVGRAKTAHHAAPTRPGQRFDLLILARVGAAAGVAWMVARTLTHTPNPYLAPVAAILCLQVTVAASWARSAERSAAVVLGLWLAVAYSHWLGVSTTSVTLLAILGVGLGQLLGLGAQGMVQIAVTALLILAIHRPAYAWARGIDTLVGAGVATTVTAAFSPPRAPARAWSESRRVVGALSALLMDLAQTVEQGVSRGATRRQLVRARLLEGRLRTAEASLEQAQQELRWNWLGPRHRRTLQELETWLPLLERALDQVRGMARSLSRVASSGHVEPKPSVSPALQEAFEALGRTWQVWTEAVPLGPQRTWDPLRIAAKAADQAIARAWSAWRAHPEPNPEWVAILIDLEKMREDIASGLSQLPSLRRVRP